MKTSITVVRHGETEWNVSRQLQGRQNSDLTANGIKQAKLTAEVLKNCTFDVLYTSDLRRAIETAEIINAYHNLNIRIDAALAERNFGIMEGLTQEEIQEKYPEVFNAYIQRNENSAIPEGESLVSFYNRVIKALGNIEKLNRGKNILLITHGGVLDCIIRFIFQYPLSAPRSFSIYNASINRFSVADENWFLEEWGYTGRQLNMRLSLDI